MDAMSMALHIAYHHTASLPSAILWNSSKGGDADSVGAVLGQIIGSYFDIRWIPFEWVKMIFRWDGEPCGTVLRRSIKLFQLANMVQK
jgi:ADP-ribosylglycohydrolase